VLGRLIDACEREGQRLPAPVYYAPVTASP
jgi:hypothetical protein